MHINIVKYHKSKSIKIMLFTFLTVFPLYVTSFVFFFKWKFALCGCLQTTQCSVKVWTYVYYLFLFFKGSVISKARQIIAVINQGFLAFEERTAQQCDSKVSPSKNLKDKKAEITDICTYIHIYIYIQASITLTEAMRAAVDIYCISSKAVG